MDMDMDMDMPWPVRSVALSNSLTPRHVKHTLAVPHENLTDYTAWNTYHTETGSMGAVAALTVRTASTCPALWTAEKIRLSASY